MKIKNQDPLRGIWFVTRTQRKNPDNGWYTESARLYNQLTFKKICINKSNNNDSVLSGSIEYDPEYAERSKYEYVAGYFQLGFLNPAHPKVHGSERPVNYLVRLGNNKLILYDLTQIDPATGDFLFRIILKRYNSINLLFESVKWLFP